MTTKSGTSRREARVHDGAHLGVSSEGSPGSRMAGVSRRPGSRHFHSSAAPDPPKHHCSCRSPDASGDHDPQACLGLDYRPAQSTGGGLHVILTDCLQNSRSDGLVRGRRPTREQSCFRPQKNPTAARRGRSQPCRDGGTSAFTQAALGNRQRPYRRRSSNPSPPKSSPNTALKPLGSISGTPEGPLTGLASRKPTLSCPPDGASERLKEDDT